MAYYVTPPLLSASHTPKKNQDVTSRHVDVPKYVIDSSFATKILTIPGAAGRLYTNSLLPTFLPQYLTLEKKKRKKRKEKMRREVLGADC